MTSLLLELRKLTRMIVLAARNRPGWAVRWTRFTKVGKVAGPPSANGFSGSAHFALRVRIAQHRAGGVAKRGRV